MTTQEPEYKAPVQIPQKAGWGAWAMVVVLTLAYTVSFIDRQVLNLLVEPLKAEFDLSDTRLSLLQGLAFTSAYIVFSPIFGRMSDTSNRRNIVLGGVAVWSIFTALCGLARNYWQMFGARVGVGAAEASLTPAAWSMIADRFPPHLLPRAMSILLMGPYIGGGLALIFGGLLLEFAENNSFGSLDAWQVVFIAAAVPGVLICAILLLIREPARSADKDGAEEAAMPLAEVWRGFRARGKFYFNFYAGMSGIVIALYAFPAWMPAVLMRKFGAEAASVGLHYGTLVLIGGSLGVLAGPTLGRLLEKKGLKGSLMVVPLIGASAIFLLSIGLALAGSYEAGLVFGGLASFAYSLPMAAASGALQIVTPNRMRGMASAIYVFIVSVIGLGAAPTIVALITDLVIGDEARVDQSLAITCAGAALVSLFLLVRARRAYIDLAAND
ncbi:spinster family MFS transporter [Croceicoccus pelagius]|uniref:MFS transporter n=1 Tax=Croceicoccus pelagius TaxID=1703341 RepID=A0A916YGQ3_9SPHN|nr:MFS transporter [Croceicoccus pelagius]GGD44606.1 MFS transporter [Croceicoccus pelagius]